MTEIPSRWDRLSPAAIREFGLAALLDHIDHGDYDSWSGDRTAMRQRAVSAWDEIGSQR